MSNFNYLVYKIIVNFCLKKILGVIMKIFRIDILQFYYELNGIGKYQNNKVSGEEYLLKKLSQFSFLIQEKSIVVFDIGANVGNYSKLISKYLPQAQIYSFEPNLKSFNDLQSIKINNFNCYQLGLSSSTCVMEMYDHSSQGSEHGSLYKESFSLVHRINNISSSTFNATTVDKFCKDNKIDVIDFIKIDVEGHDLDVIKGCQYLLLNNRIHLIQFEFTQINIISRVFLRDFYEILQKYKIYRLDSNNLIPLFEYQVSNEIFQYQNFLAVHEEIHEAFTTMI